ncbi:MAG TPA: IS110 family transposase [Candidatus Limnocylindrales bacterium]|nr:IS110 family transposase [Candidatus Limnocylindrales bacterium]
MSTDVFAGLDWAVRSHAVCVVDAHGAVLERFEIAHDRDGLVELMRRLARFGASVRIAIERPSGLIVDALVEAGHRVFPIHPNAVKASRPRYRSHGAKSDASDAYLLADLLRTDGHRWAALSQQSDSIRALRVLVRARDDLVATRVALANQLRTSLQAFWPGAAAIFADVDSPIALAFVRRYPTPASAAKLTQAGLQRFCRAQHYSGHRPPAELLARLRSAAQGHGGDVATLALAEVVRSLVAVLAPLVEHIGALSRRIGRFVESLPDGQIVMSFPRAGRVCAAQILAELGDVRERFATLDRLCAEAGVVPLTYQSGKTRSVGFRWACNHRLRRAITCMADNSRHANAWAKAIYAAARARGCDHPHAIRILARAWLRVLWRAWMDRKPYDPALHKGALNVSSTQGG